MYLFFYAFQVSDYLEVIRQPMDLSTVMTKIDTHQYLTAKDFLVDIDLICSNALEYNPDKDPGGEEENVFNKNTQIHMYGFTVFVFFKCCISLILILPPLSKMSPSQFKSLTVIVKMVDALFLSQDLGP